MAKTALGIGLFAILSISGLAQSDTAKVIPADSTGINQTFDHEPHKQSVKTWPIATAVALILLSSYLLYNVRSR